LLLKPEGEFAIHHIIPCCLKCDSFKGRLHRYSFPRIFFFLSSRSTWYILVFAEYPNEDKTIKKKNYNRLIASLESHYIFGALKRGGKEKATSIINSA